MNQVEKICCYLLETRRKEHTFDPLMTTKEIIEHFTITVKKSEIKKALKHLESEREVFHLYKMNGEIIDKWGWLADE